jgi:hypothetical protein
MVKTQAKVPEAMMRAAVLDVQGGMPLETAAKRHGIA